MKTVCAIAIVKNESKTIERCLNSVKDIIDYFIIIDTGSTDNTIEIINKWTEKTGICGEIYQHKWVNFSVNRTEALQLAKGKSDYALLMDADEVIISNNFNKESLTADAYYLHYVGDCDYAQILLINNRLNWVYKSVTHEYIYSDEAKTYVDIKTLQMQHFYDGGNRTDKFNRDIALLKQGIIDEPNNSRYYFYLGQSHKDLEMYQEAIDYYVKTINLSNWVEEGFYSRYQIALCFERLGKINEAKIAYLKAWEFRPTRAEALYHLAVLCRNNKEYQQAYLFCKRALEIPYPSDHLFLEKSVYDYMLLFEKSINAYYIGNYKESYDDCKTLLAKEEVSTSIKNQTRLNIQYSEQKLFGKEITTKFDKELATEILKELSRSFVEIDLQYCVIAGTLLGLTRENDFLDHDEDIDIGIIGDENIYLITAKLIENGFVLLNTFGKKGESLEYRFSYKGLQVDLFVFYEEDNKYYHAVLDNRGKVYKYFQEKFKIIYRLFKDILVGIPENPEKYLETQYGKGWIKENKNWHYLDALNKI